MREFRHYHPIVNFVYFIFVIALGMFIMHPISLVISFIGGFIYSVMLNGRKALRFNVLFLLPMLFLAMLINPTFSHEGVTILAYLPSGNPLTLESIIYGGAAGLVLINVICWFSCYNNIMTSDKFIYLFGRIIPSLSLILSMTLRFVPRFRAQLAQISTAQRCIGRDVNYGSVIHRIKCGMNIISIMITWMLENSIETADSMKNRGYGLDGRTAFSIFVFDRRDAVLLTSIILLGIYVTIGQFLGGMYFAYFPSFVMNEISVYGFTVFLAYFILCFIPIITDMLEVKQRGVLQN